MLNDTTEVEQAVECPSWCARERFHDLGEPFRRHEGPLVAASATVTGGAGAFLIGAMIARHDSPDRRGEPTVDLLDGADLEFTPHDARALGLALLEFADRAQRAPRRTGGARRYRGRLVVSRAVHDAVLCGWRVATRDDDRPELAWCAGCGCAVEIGDEEGV